LECSVGLGGKPRPRTWNQPAPHPTTPPWRINCDPSRILPLRSDAVGRFGQDVLADLRIPVPSSRHPQPNQRDVSRQGVVWQHLRGSPARLQRMPTAASSMARRWSRSIRGVIYLAEAHSFRSMSRRCGNAPLLLS
uniref:Os01g0778700 protein n=1 Tax=Heligmosomoides polygyrus TaxID=6339 RepID=A0A183G8P5_HELPZ